VLLSYLSTEISDKNYIMIINKLSKNNILDELTELEKEKPSDGIIILGTNLTGAHIAPVTTAFSNLVVIDTACNCINCNTITMNNYLGAFEAVDYLIKIGHRKIGYIKGTPRINNFIERRRGFKDALWKNGIDSKDSPKYYLPGMKIQIIDEKLNQFLEFVNSVTAIFCEDDYIAISVIKTLNQCGIQVPRDVSVIGFDDIPESQVTTPELTTIQVPIKQIAKETINLIEHGFEDENPYKKQIYVNPYLVLRNSVQSLE
jgi:LacI family transcriptional regulator